MKPEQCAIGGVPDDHPAAEVIREVKAWLDEQPHRCNIAMLGRSWRSEGCGWRCPGCGAEWTLKRADKPVEDHVTPYGVHPRTQCGPAFCTLLPPRPTMVWVRDEVAG